MQHDIEVAQVLLKCDAVQLVTIHNGPHPIAEEAKLVYSKNTQRILVSWMLHPSIYRKFMKSVRI